ncbi:hypothetical protein BP6252_02095 [Coleophoma cylindrospora]|uniref:Alpha/beta hydrolase fold-3 domain-containing protein n=1 Tax=Coleophoma cylindrospora TaxID=1849047 RepID=A0A3D8SDU0_9HELO|nr:hypothetical protein BP6252_02095 [Coleophoma cylindrospora]
MAIAAEENSSKFDKFNITPTVYKTVNGQDIDLYTFVPKDISLDDGVAHPVIVHFHGGFLITGSAIYPDWCAQWFLDYALLHSAIIVAPNYRLLPESNGLDIMEDIRDFWAWTQTSLPGAVAPLKVDLNRIVAYGESAGGYLAIQTGLLGIKGVKALISAYGVFAMDLEWYNSPTFHPMGAPTLPVELLEAHLAAMKPGQIVSSAIPPERTPIVACGGQQGKLAAWLGDDDSLYPGRLLKKGTKSENDQDAPFLFSFAGREDTSVPCEETTTAVEAWKERFGDDKAYAVLESGDHGFDINATLETDWLAKGLEMVTKQWLG